MCDEGQRGGQRGRNHRHAHCKTSEKRKVSFTLSAFISSGAHRLAARGPPKRSAYVTANSPNRLRFPSKLIRMPESMLPHQPEPVSASAYRNTWSSMLGSQVYAALQIMRMQILHSSAGWGRKKLKLDCSGIYSNPVVCVVFCWHCLFALCM